MASMNWAIIGSGNTLSSVQGQVINGNNAAIIDK